MAAAKRGRARPRKTTRRGSPRPSRTAGAGPEVSASSASLQLFRKAVLGDPHLQDRLRAARTCGAVATIANEYLRSNVRVVLSSELERSQLRAVAEKIAQSAFHVSEADLKAYLESNTSQEGEFLLGQSELAMVAGSSRVASTNECSYGSGCGSCGCSSSLACVCK